MPPYDSAATPLAGHLLRGPGAVLGKVGKPARIGSPIVAGGCLAAKRDPVAVSTVLGLRVAAFRERSHL